MMDSRAASGIYAEYAERTSSPCNAKTFQGFELSAAQDVVLVSSSARMWLPDRDLRLFCVGALEKQRLYPSTSYGRP